jgi:hypothetical protein
MLAAAGEVLVIAQAQVAATPGILSKLRSIGTSTSTFESTSFWPPAATSRRI